jgi:DNA-binding XRE family transcriptional regulator
MPDPIPFAEVQRRRLEAFGNSPPVKEEVTPPALPLPGTCARLELMKARARSGEPCHQAGDVLHHPEVLVDPRNSRNGQRKKMANRGQAKVPPAYRGQKPTTVVVEKLAGRLKSCRLHAALSQKEAALQAGISQQALSLLEAGKRSARAHVLLSLASLYGVSLDWLIGRDG